MFSRSIKGTGRALRSFWSASRGVVAIEFAFVGFPFIMLLVSIIVIGFLLYCSASLDYATQKAARQIMTGSVQSSGLTASQFQTSVLCPYLPSTFDCTKIAVSLTSFSKTAHVYTKNNYYQFVNATQTGLTIPPLVTSTNSFCSGVANSYEVLEVMYPMPIYLSMLASAPNVVNGQFVLMSTATFKNEPFSNGVNSSTGC